MVNIITTGKPYKEVATALSRDFGVRYHEAQRLIRTEMARVGIESTLKTYADMGFEYVIVEGVPDDKECGEQCEQHWYSHTHKKIPIGKAEVGIDGSDCGLPPYHPNCRCSISLWRDENV